MEYAKQACSMNGNIYRALDIREWLNDEDCGSMVDFIESKRNRPYVACGNQSCVVSHCDRFTKEQNGEFLNNKHIDLNPFLFFDTQRYDVTYDIPLNLEWRN
jgi:hypothetical protein